MILALLLPYLWQVIDGNTVWGNSTEHSFFIMTFQLSRFIGWEQATDITTHKAIPKSLNTSSSTKPDYITLQEETPLIHTERNLQEKKLRKSPRNMIKQHLTVNKTSWGTHSGFPLSKIVCACDIFSGIMYSRMPKGLIHGLYYLIRYHLIDGNM